MNYPCYHRFPSGRFCKCPAENGSRFCHSHAHDAERQRQLDARPLDTTHPLSRLASRHDVFDVVREAINATRLGSLTPSQAYAIGYLADVWLRINRGFDYSERQEALRRQYLRGVLAEEAALVDDAEPASAPEAPRPAPLAASPQPASLPTSVPPAPPDQKESPVAPAETPNTVPAPDSASPPTSAPPPPFDPFGEDPPPSTAPGVDATDLLLNALKLGLKHQAKSKRTLHPAQYFRASLNGRE